MMGLICDPVAGLVEVPCVKRNALGSSQAFISADMALAGIRSVIPPDEVIHAMYQVGRQMPQIFKETAEGGLAVTPTAQRLSKEILEKQNRNNYSKKLTEKMSIRFSVSFLLNNLFRLNQPQRQFHS